MSKWIFAALYLLFLNSCAITQNVVTEQQLRGSNNDGRNWWDVQHYTLDVFLDVNTRTIEGKVTIVFKTIGKGQWMMIDLQDPLAIQSITHNGKKIQFTDNGSYYKLDCSSKTFKKLDSITVTYQGIPHEAKHAPWDGGIVWTKDKQSRTVVASACQGIGASIWWPCKDIQSDEPDNGVDMKYRVDKEYAVIGNGRLIQKTELVDFTTQWHWRVTNPINIYNVSINIGHYKEIMTNYQSDKGILPVRFWVYDYNLDKGKAYIPEILEMLTCFESKLGPYPFYQDGYNLIETPHLGMEHQSGIAYGNKFMRGYLGDDRSKTGYGLHWDFILIHESGHEWFGNNITAEDVNDNWIHEGFTTYTESIFTECKDGKEAGAAYVRGQRRLIANDRPLINQYGVRYDPPGDIYDKGANIVHTIRTMMDDDVRFYGLLKAMNARFYHQVVTSQQIEKFIMDYTQMDLNVFFEQYLRTIMIPELQYSIADGKIAYQWANALPRLSMPVKLFYLDGSFDIITVTDQPQSKDLNDKTFGHWDENIYCTFKRQ